MPAGLLSLPVLLAAALLVLFASLAGVLYGQARGNDRLERRKQWVAAAGRGRARGGKGEKGPTSRRRMMESAVKELEAKQKAHQKRSLRVKLRQAGLNVSETGFYIASAVAGVVAAVASVPLGAPMPAAPLIGVIFGLGAPRFFLKKKAERRQRHFTQNFADAVDVIVRGIRSGLPVGECLKIVGRESPEPVGEIFRQITEGQKLGMTMEDLMERSLQTMPTSELKFFAIVIIIQSQTGGNLADTLENLSRVLRERKKMGDKVQALASEAKSSAMIIGSLPFVVALGLTLITPDYIGVLVANTAGHVMLAGVGLWMGLGIFIMHKMVNFEV